MDKPPPPPPSFEGTLRPTPRSLAMTSLSTPSTLGTLSPPAADGGRERSANIRRDPAAGWGGDATSFADCGVADAAAARSHVSADDNINADNDWGWRLQSKAVHPVSPFFPMDPRSTRRILLATTCTQEWGGSGVNENTTKEISHRISTACHKLSVHGIWNNNSPSAKLSSMERVEMEVNIYLDNATRAPSSPPHVVIVEVQRRKGCSVTFHNYRRCLLEAAEGKFDSASFHEKDGLDKPLGRDRTNQPRASLGRPRLGRLSSSPSVSRPGLARPSLSPSGRSSLARPSPPGRPTVGRPSPMGRPSRIARPSPSRPQTLAPLNTMARPGLRPPLSPTAAGNGVPITGLQTKGESSDKEGDDTVVEKALKALNMAASLIKKDRVDAQRLGMESLVLLTDPLRAGIETAKFASRVVLLGISNEDDAGVGSREDDVNALFDESAGLGIREAILKMIMDESDAEEKMPVEDDGFQGIEKEFTDIHFTLCLTVLSNALHTIDESVKTAAAPSTITAPPNRAEQGDTEGDDVKSLVAIKSGVPKRFIDDTHSAFGCDILSSLIRILDQAKTNPHDACLSARCLGVLFEGCGNSNRVRARRDLDAKRVVAAALEVGCRSHAKLEDASRVAMMALVKDE